jgi:hypothetical protein
VSRDVFELCVSAALVTGAVFVGTAIPSCSGDDEQQGATSSVSSVASSGGAGQAGSGGSGGAGGHGGGASSSMSSASGCMVTIGGCYDAMECTAWATCECPNLPCEADCVAYRQCASACGDANCLEACKTQHAQGADQNDAILQCAHCGADPCLGSLCNGVMPPIMCP